MIDQNMLNLTPPQVEENEITLYVGTTLFQTFLCTPEALEELGVGHLYCRGIISEREDITKIEISKIEQDGLDKYEIRVELKNQIEKDRKRQDSFQMPSVSHLQDLAANIKDLAGKYRSHGGIHCAALSDSRDIVSLYEDVGRHNAFDKAIGAAVIKGIRPSELIYFSSGRINSEIAEKAAVCRLPLLVSRSIATTRACFIAGGSNTCIIGRIESKIPFLYTASTRE
ncbi:hypothetical protein EXM22_00970 [Oceanispirochaeta crateris]|uniref:Formate dehydrogenase accessory sulfurtransferase FdhD n=1 Tax=Oceanispirochaeta crateris TaxID=2518645 RepID=A0A5C1QH26_9SPIO|nr:formate dehydrogenase accessory sulfurtransferase FdhD [Oceanispirochaeta crateris]QEN06628.1 hypothetical protein EXM22_00970 [Oceanispirochaeta crateris]